MIVRVIINHWIAYSVTDSFVKSGIKKPKCFEMVSENKCC